MPDALAKYINADEIRWHMNEVSQSYESGRHPLNPLPDASRIRAAQDQVKEITDD